VRERWQPMVERVILPEDVRATTAVVKALEASDVVILAPSNPFISIDPILNVYPIRALIEDSPQAVIAISPIIAGRAVKGPAAKMMAEMNVPVSAAAVAAYYGHLIDGFIYDAQDEGLAAEDGLALLCTDTLMPGSAERERLAREVLQFAAEMT
jgi:LPPG:FO 2-phospho-L-lactate transferase